MGLHGLAQPIRSPYQSNRKNLSTFCFYQNPHVQNDFIADPLAPLKPNTPTRTGLGKLQRSNTAAMLSIKEANVLNRQQMNGNGGKNRYDFIEGGSRPREPNRVIPEVEEPKNYASVLRPYNRTG